MAVFGGTLTGEFLSIELLIPQYSTARCHPDFKFPDDRHGVMKLQ